MSICTIQTTITFYKQKLSWFGWQFLVMLAAIKNVVNIHTNFELFTFQIICFCYNNIFLIKICNSDLSILSNFSSSYFFKFLSIEALLIFIVRIIVNMIFSIIMIIFITWVITRKIRFISFILVFYIIYYLKTCFEHSSSYIHSSF